MEKGWQRRSPKDPGSTPETRSAESTTFFDADCEFEGSLSLPNSIRIEGEFRGEIASKETVVIGPEAAVQAKIKARTVIILGAVVGDVEASREVVLEKTARLHGDVETPSLAIKRGAFFRGTTRMFRPGTVRPAASETPATAPSPATS